MDPELKVDARIYLDALRRLWWVVGVFVFGLTASLLINSNARSTDPAPETSRRFVETTTLMIVQESRGFDRQFHLADIGTRLISSDIEKEVEERVSINGKLATTVDRDVLTLVVETNTSNGTLNLTDAYIQAAIRINKQATIADARDQLSASKVQIVAINESLAALDKQISIGSDPKVVGLLMVQRKTTADPLPNLETYVALLQNILVNVTGRFEIMERKIVDLNPPDMTVKSTWSSTTRSLVFGTSGGLVIGFLAVVILLMFDKTLRGKRDIEASFDDASLIGILTTPASDDNSRHMAALLMLFANKLTRAEVALIPITNRDSANQAAHALAQYVHDGYSLTTTNLINEFSVTDFERHQTTFNVFICNYAKTSKTDLAYAASLFDRAGCKLNCIILVNVPNKLAHLF